MSQPDLSFFDPGDGPRLAYRHRPGSGPTIVFLPGYASDMEGTKALALDAFAKRHGRALLRFDYSGTGSSGGEFADGTLGRWLGETLAVVDRLAEGPLLLVGSSMGGWLALHVALARPERVRAIIGLAAAPDFTRWGLGDAHRAELERDGRFERPSRYGPDPVVMHRDFWQSGEQLCLLDGQIAIEAPVRLIHGQADQEVPLAVALKLMEALGSADVQLQLIKGSGHRLSESHEIDVMLRTLDLLLEKN